MDHIDISQETIEAYERDGCVHVPGAFAGYWQERLRDAPAGLRLACQANVRGDVRVATRV